MMEHTIKYTTTKAHLVYFSFVHTFRQNALRVLFAIPLIYLVWKIIVEVNRRQAPFHLKLAIVIAVILAYVVFIFLLHLMMTLLLYMSRGKNPGVLTTHTVTLNENGIDSVSAAGNSHQTWSSIIEVRRTRNFIIIYTQQHAAHLIPLSAFASREAADEFYSFAYSAVSKNRVGDG
jgi:YcxB-like protein